MTSIYKVVWSTEHNSGELPYEFVGMDLALQGGREWKAEMVAIDPDPVSAIEEYQWEVVRIDPPLLERNGPEGNVFQPTAVMTLAEAIEHAEEMGIGDSFCNANHRQLADWLKELRLHRRH